VFSRPDAPEPVAILLPEMKLMTDEEREIRIVEENPGEIRFLLHRRRGKGGGAATLDRPIEILVVEDNPGDVRLMKEALAEANVRTNVTHVEDGVEALALLRHEGKYADAPFPDLVILDLNLPRKDGREVLQEIKQDEALRRLPVVIMTTSEAETDISRTFNLRANCYVTKPWSFEEFSKLVKAIEKFWLSLIEVPEKG
jgi:two-component system, chemotaxis family, response regulator Rcp1